MLKKFIKLFHSNLNKVKSDSPIKLEFTVEDIDNLVNYSKIWQKQSE
jgi:hypothetical protein